MSLLLYQLEIDCSLWSDREKIEEQKCWFICPPVFSDILNIAFEKKHLTSTTEYRLVMVFLSPTTVWDIMIAYCAVSSHQLKAEQSDENCVRTGSSCICQLMCCEHQMYRHLLVAGCHNISISLSEVDFFL